MFPPTHNLTLSLQTDYGDMPLGTRVFYMTDGSDPGVDASGEPTDGILFTSATDIPFGVTEVKARVYPPVLYRQWFLPSEPEVAAIAPGTFPVSFTMAVSTTPEF